MCGILTASGGWIGGAALADPSIPLERILEAAGAPAAPGASVPSRDGPVPSGGGGSGIPARLGG